MMSSLFYENLTVNIWPEFSQIEIFTSRGRSQILKGERADKFMRELIEKYYQLPEGSLDTWKGVPAIDLGTEAEKAAMAWECFRCGIPLTEATSKLLLNNPKHVCKNSTDCKARQKYIAKATGGNHEKT
jgi:hypothetical protein